MVWLPGNAVRMRNPRKNQPLARQHGPHALLALSQLTLDRMEQGVCVYDADNRIVLLNRRYVELFGMSGEIVRPGTCYRDVLAHSAALGNFPASEIDGLYREHVAQIARGERFRIEQRLACGLVMALDMKPLPEVGWITICEDVTRLDRLAAQLRLQTESRQHALA